MGFNLENYDQVKDRIPEFWKRYPDGSIVTSLERSSDDFQQVLFKATLLNGGAILATGFAYEEKGKAVNADSWVENCETSAVGRALANLNVVIGHERPSREEMAKVQRSKESREAPPDRDEPAEGNHEAKLYRDKLDEISALIKDNKAWIGEDRLQALRLWFVDAQSKHGELAFAEAAQMALQIRKELAEMKPAVQQEIF